MTDVELGRIAAEIDAAGAEARRYRAIDWWRAYPSQRQFFATGAQFRELALFAGNQVGKSTSLAFETAVHATGLYPPDWEGRRWDRLTRGWVVGESSKTTRDIIQRKLCGEPGSEEDFGSGMIPKHLFIPGGLVLAHGEKNTIDRIQVRHVSGGISIIKFRSYNQGRSALQGESLDYVWCDEECDADIYAELLTRISATGGMLMISFTPRKGMSDISARYRQEFSAVRTYVQYGISQIPDWGHIPPAERAAIIAGYPEHERDARANGEPMLGSGKIYQTPEADIIEDAPLAAVPELLALGRGCGFRD